MAIFMKEILDVGWNMGKVCIGILLEIFMMENIIMTIRVDLGLWNFVMEINIEGNGIKISFMELAATHLVQRKLSMANLTLEFLSLNNKQWNRHLEKE
jgi:hypothetical protein